MTVHIHALRGCTPTPLAHYLKALGVLRLIGEQVDPGARLYWREEHATLSTSLDEPALLAFFAKDYHPTPMLAPWNGGSGFYPRDNASGIAALRSSVAGRFAPFRAAIVEAEGLVAGREESPKDEEKQAFIAACRRRWRAGAGRWLAAAVMLGDDLAPAYPALLGTGGNDGRLDFTNNLMQRLAELFACAESEAPATLPAQALLASALFAGPVPGLLRGKAIGQFHPGGAGGANASTGFDGDSLLNPWDFVLMLEGAVLWSASVARRLGGEAISLVTAPFALRAQAAGHGTVALGEDAPRGEQWLPLWDRAATCAEVTALLREGRLVTPSGGAHRPADAARAVARLGTARGIVAFERIGFLERNGQANLAIPLGRWQVRPRPDMDLVDHAAGWVDRFSRAARDGAPAAWSRAARRCDEAILACCRSDDRAARLELLLALGAAESTLARSSRKAAEKSLRPLHRLPAGWLAALPEVPEVRLAVAIAAQDADGLPLRDHWLTVDQGAFASASDVEVVVQGDDAIADALAILRRRCREGGPFPLRPAHGIVAGLADIADLLRGAVDSSLLWALVRPLLALDWRAVTPLAAPARRADDLGLLAGFALLRLAHAPDPLPGCQRAPGVDPAMLVRLNAGDAAGASAIAVRRLVAQGLRPSLTRLVRTPSEARLLGASLLIPIGAGASAALHERLARPVTTSEPSL